MRISDKGINALSNGINNAFKAWGQMQLNKANAETNRLHKGAAVQRALAGADNLNIRTDLARQKYDAIQAVLDQLRGEGLGDRGTRNEMITAVNGKAYLPNAAIGNTGAVIDKGTGRVAVDPGNALTRVFMGVQDSLIRQHNAAANAHNASAASHYATRDKTLDQMRNPGKYMSVTYKTGVAKTGATSGGDKGKLPSSATMKLIFSKPEIGADGKPVVDLMTGKPSTTFDSDAAAAAIVQLRELGLPLTEQNLASAKWGILPKSRPYVGPSEQGSAESLLLGDSVPLKTPGAVSQAVAAANPPPSVSAPVAPSKAPTFSESFNQAKQNGLIQDVRTRVRNGELTADQGMAELAKFGIK